VYYNQTRTHLALNKDCPLERPIQRFGSVVATPVLAGLHINTSGYDFRKGHTGKSRWRHNLGANLSPNVRRYDLHQRSCGCSRLKELRLPYQLRRPCDVRSNAPRLVARALRIVQPLIWVQTLPRGVPGLTHSPRSHRASAMVRRYLSCRRRNKGEDRNRITRRGRIPGSQNDRQVAEKALHAKTLAAIAATRRSESQARGLL